MNPDIVFPLVWTWESEGEKRFLSCQDCPQLEDMGLFIESGDLAIQQELRTLAGKIGGGMAALLLFAVVISRFPSRRLLAPVSSLFAGIQAIGERRFDVRIPVVSEDEFGHVARSFNEMIAGLSDLEIARVLQTRFFPENELKIGAWEIYGHSKSASQVGGDYFDYFLRPDGCLVAMIGDVAGHGVGAALVVAMAKALVAHSRTEMEPHAILDLMQTVFSSTLRRKKMMTFFVLVFHPETGRLLVSNAGHCFPFLIRAGGVVETMKLPGFPLGAKRKASVSVEERLGPGDRMFLCTDGLPEAIGHDGQQIGYDRLMETLRDLEAPDAKTAVDHLFAWQHASTAPGPQGDDITLVMLQQRRD